MAIGLLTLPFNLHHLGTEAYGLWMLTAGVTIHFSILDLGYGGAMVKFVAQYRAHKDSRALNEIASTMFVPVRRHRRARLPRRASGWRSTSSTSSSITPAQAETGKWILLIIGVNVAINFPFSVYGGVSNGFQRYDINNVVAIASSVAGRRGERRGRARSDTALIALVAATTVGAVRRPTSSTAATPTRSSRRCASGPSLFRKDRLREVTGFSIYASIIDWANKLNYELDEIVIGVFLGPAPVAVWAVADRIISGTQRLTNQGNAVLFPVVVDSEATQQASAGCRRCCSKARGCRSRRCCRSPSC